MFVYSLLQTIFLKPLLKGKYSKFNTKQIFIIVNFARAFISGGSEMVVLLAHYTNIILLPSALTW